MRIRCCPVVALCLAFAPSVFSENAALDTYGFRRLIATLSPNGQLAEIAVDGECSFPDDTTLNIFVEHRGELCDQMQATARVKDQAFNTRLSTNLKLLPGYYVIRAQYDPAWQEGSSRDLLKGVPVKSVMQAIGVGTDKEVKEVRDEHLKMYEGQLSQIEETFAKEAAAYAEMVKHHDMRETPLQWNRQFGNVPDDANTALQGLQKMFADCVIPVFPLLHSWTIEGWGIVKKLHNQLTDGLTIEITEAMSRKGTNREFFLESAKKQMAAYLKGMRAQIALERKLEHREAVVHDITILSHLYEESSGTFDQMKSVSSDEIKTAWKGFMGGKDGKGGWRGELKALAVRLGTYRGGEIDKEYSELVDLLVGAPGCITKLWDLFDEVMVGGKREADLHKRINQAHDECYIHIYPVMEVLGFNREVFNRVMQQYQGASEDGAPDPEPAAATVTDYVQTQVDKLGTGDPDAESKAVQVLMKLGDTARKVLKDMLEGGRVKNNQRSMGLVVVCLGRMGEKSVEPRLLGMLNDDPEAAMRAGAAMALPQVGGTELLPSLEKVLHDDKAAVVRAACANALALLHLPAAIPNLIQAFMDEDPSVRQAAHSAANSLAGVQFHFAPDSPEAQRKADMDQAMQWWNDNKEKLLNAPAPSAGGAKEPGK